MRWHKMRWEEMRLDDIRWDDMRRDEIRWEEMRSVISLPNSNCYNSIIIIMNAIMNIAINDQHL